ncbi:FAD-dependent oxidoreductase, partial [Candidatus Kaiserbacteria bacterium]|nr:FAD-dependent oxidoreductase [Candidatus Kaiserbacteria bacterium]
RKMSTDFPTAPLAPGHKGAGGGTVEKSHHASHTKNLTLPKLIVASSVEQDAKLADIKRLATANGVNDLSFLTAAEAMVLEPELHCTSAILSPSTGIVDSHGLMLALLGDAERHRAMLAVQSPLVSAAVRDDGIEIVAGGESSTTLRADIVINSAGLSAPAVAGLIDKLPQALVPRPYLAKGNYFSLAGKSPFSILIYPVPEAGGLGVHLTLDLGEQARFGQDVEWIDVIDYHVAPERCQRFYGAIRTYWPRLSDAALQPAYSGIRPKIAGPNEIDADFLIEGPVGHGIPGLINLFGIESPGLTSCLSIAEAVRESLDLEL